MEICINSKLLSFYTPKMNAVIKYWNTFRALFETKMNKNTTTINLTDVTSIYEWWTGPLTPREYRLKLTEDKMLRGTFLTDKLRWRVEQTKINVWKSVKSLSLRMFIQRMSGERRDERRQSKGAVSTKMILVNLKIEWMEG